MKQPSAADSSTFRAMTGDELLEVLTEHIKVAAATVLAKSDGRFSQGRAYPVASVAAVIRIGLYHDTRQDAPYKVADVPLRFWTFVRPDESISGLESVVTEEHRFTFDVGRTIDSAPDALRETHSIDVLQPQRSDSGMVTDEVVEQSEPYPRPCSLGCGKVVKSAAGQKAHQRFWCGNNPQREALIPEERVPQVTAEGEPNG